MSPTYATRSRDIGLDAAEAEMLEAAWIEIEPAAARRLLIAAVQEFATRGYHATTTRDIARGVGLSPAGVYVYFRSKEELLYRISLIGHQQALAAVRAATGESDEPELRLRAVVGGFSAWHARYHTPARVIQYELGALSDAHYTEIAGVRRQIDSAFKETIMYGVRARTFDVPDISGTSLALVSLAIDVARWYRPSGQRTPEGIGRLYADLAVRMLRSQASAGWPRSCPMPDRASSPSSPP